jgi:low affinity Fe/Cu permease
MSAHGREEKPKTLSDRFSAFTRWASEAVGSVWASLFAALIIVIWAVTGPLFGFSDTWQLVINTGTTIVTFLMVFLIQATQNRDSEAIQLKLDELIVALDGARDELLDSENLSEEEQLRLHRRYLQLAEQARGRIKGEVSQIEERRERRARRTKS